MSMQPWHQPGTATEPRGRTGARTEGPGVDTKTGLGRHAQQSKDGPEAAVMVHMHLQPEPDPVQFSRSQGVASTSMDFQRPNHANSQNLDRLQGLRVCRS